MIAGRYKTTRRADSTFVSLATLAGAVTITANPDDTITHSILGFPVRYREVKPFLWQEVGGHDKLQATVVDGKVVSWSTDMLTAAFSFEPDDGPRGRGAGASARGPRARADPRSGSSPGPRAPSRGARSPIRACCRARRCSRSARAGVFAILAIVATIAWLGALRPRCDPHAEARHVPAS